MTELTGQTVHAVHHRWDDGEDFNDTVVALFSTIGQAELYKSKLVAVDDPRYNAYTIEPMVIDEAGQHELTYIAQYSGFKPMLELPLHLVQVRAEAVGQELPKGRVFTSEDPTYPAIDFFAYGWTPEEAIEGVNRLFVEYSEGRYHD